MKELHACLKIIADLGSQRFNDGYKREIYFEWALFELIPDSEMQTLKSAGVTSTVAELSIREGSFVRLLFQTHTRPGLPPTDFRRANLLHLLGSWCLMLGPVEGMADEASLRSRLNPMQDFRCVSLLSGMKPLSVQLVEEDIPALKLLPADIRRRAESSPEWKHLITIR
jgi:hypothetical protein